MTKKIPDEVQKRIDKIAEAFRQRLIEMYQWSNEKEERAPTAVEIEAMIIVSAISKQVE